MSQVHPQARTTPLTRTEIRCSTASTTCLAERYNFTRATARKLSDLQPIEPGHDKHKKELQGLCARLCSYCYQVVAADSAQDQQALFVRRH